MLYVLLCPSSFQLASSWHFCKWHSLVLFWLANCELSRHDGKSHYCHRLFCLVVIQHCCPKCHHLVKLTQISQTQPLHFFSFLRCKNMVVKGEARSNALPLFCPPVHFLLSCLIHTHSAAPVNDFFLCFCPQHWRSHPGQNGVWPQSGRHRGLHPRYQRWATAFGVTAPPSPIHSECFQGVAIQFL